MFGKTSNNRILYEVVLLCGGGTYFWELKILEPLQQHCCTTTATCSEASRFYAVTQDNVLIFPVWGTVVTGLAILRTPAGSPCLKGGSGDGHRPLGV